ncbi:DUF551 domain-containing protein [Klebsiella pneumoniae]|uniref:DUF551 domain-containing protein n=1 Tax=Klebsiella pneumoniae TaxID=573 RepID=UPI001FA97603|nr:DUF551 domain-containing protein [Klebsiella pneumoniae]
MSILTKEGIQKILNDDWLLMDDCEGLENCTVIKELARMALAAMDSEPVGYFGRFDPDDEDIIDQCSKNVKGSFPLYRHAQQAPVVPNGLRLALSNAGIAAPESDEMLAATCEKHIQALVTWVKDRKPFQSAPVVPSFEEWLSAANRKPLGWVKDAMREAYDACRAAMLQAGNSPVIPDGWTCNDKANAALMMLDRIETVDPVDDDRIDGIKRIVRELAAAPHDTPALNSVQNVVTVPGKWIPVSEQMPDDDDFVYIWPRPDFGVELHVGQYCERSHKGGGWYAQVYEQNHGIEWHPITVTHWMQLPAAPQEVK